MHWRPLGLHICHYRAYRYMHSDNLVLNIMYDPKYIGLDRLHSVKVAQRQSTVQ